MLMPVVRQGPAPDEHRKGGDQSANQSMSTDVQRACLLPCTTYSLVSSLGYETVVLFGALLYVEAWFETAGHWITGRWRKSVGWRSSGCVRARCPAR